MTQNQGKNQKKKVYSYFQIGGHKDANKNVLENPWKTQY